MADGEIDRRLTSAAIYILRLEEADFPEEYKERYAAIRQRLFRVPLANKQGYTPRPISTEDGEKLARDILGLFVDVMGGL